MSESAPSNPARPIDALPIKIAYETSPVKPRSWLKRQLNRIDIAVKLWKVHHGMEPFTKRKMERIKNKVDAELRTLYNAPSIIEGLTFEQTVRQIWKKYPDGIEEMRQRLGITVPFENDMGLPLTPEQEAYLQNVREQAGKYPLDLDSLRRQMQQFNYIEAFYEKYGDKSLKPDDGPTH